MRRYGLWQSAGALLFAASLAAEASLFDYNRTADLAVHRAGSELRDGAVVEDWRFQAHPDDTSPTAAYLVRPANGPSRAGVLWGHWLGEPATTNRTQFLAEAVALAPRGVTSLLVDTPWAAPRWYQNRVLDDDFENGVRQVIAFRRAIDLLLEQTALASEQVAFVGHDYSAMYGAVALAVDGRVRRAVLIAPTARFHDWAFFRQQPSSMEAYQRENAPLELARHLGNLPAGSQVLLQFGGRDEYVSAEKREAVISALRVPHQSTVYPSSDHAMSEPDEIRRDRAAWLLQALKLD